MEGKYGGAIGGFYHATDQKQVLSSKKARLGTSHVLQRKIEAQQVIQFPGNIKTSYSTCRISPSSVSKSGSNVPSFAWSKSSSSSSSTPSSSSILTCRAESCGDCGIRTQVPQFFKITSLTLDFHELLLDSGSALLRRYPIISPLHCESTWTKDEVTQQELSRF